MMDAMMVNRFFLKPGLVLAGTVLLASCAREPSETSSYGVETPPGDHVLVSICYSASVSTRRNVIDTAMQACPAGTTGLSVIGDDTLLNECPILKKNRATFICQGVRPDPD